MARVRTAVVSSSANAPDVLRAAGISSLFDLTVDGHDIVELGLRGKPAPDGFLAAARRLEVPPARAVVVDDALAGVARGATYADLRSRRRGRRRRRPRGAPPMSPNHARAAGAPDLVESRGILIEHFGERVRLLPGAPVSCPQPDELRRAA